MTIRHVRICSLLAAILLFSAAAEPASAWFTPRVNRQAARLAKQAKKQGIRDGGAQALRASVRQRRYKNAGVVTALLVGGSVAALGTAAVQGAIIAGAAGLANTTAPTVALPLFGATGSKALAIAGGIVAGSGTVKSWLSRRNINYLRNAGTSQLVNEAIVFSNQGDFRLLDILGQTRRNGVTLRYSRLINKAVKSRALSQQTVQQFYELVAARNGQLGSSRASAFTRVPNRLQTATPNIANTNVPVVAPLAAAGLGMAAATYATPDLVLPQANHLLQNGVAGSEMTSVAAAANEVHAPRLSGDLPHPEMHDSPSSPDVGGFDFTGPPDF